MYYIYFYIEIWYRYLKCGMNDLYECLPVAGQIMACVLCSPSQFAQMYFSLICLLMNVGFFFILFVSLAK